MGNNMRIGIDVDDTITNTYDYLLDKIATYYKIDSKELISRKLNYNDFFNNNDFPNYTVFVEENYDKYISKVPIKDDAVEYLNKLYDEGYEIYIISARHTEEYKDPYRITKNYLLKNNISYNKIIIGSFNKGKTCEEEHIDLFIDDNIDNCMSAKKYGVNTLLFDAKFNRDNNNLRRVYSWKEIYDIIKKCN